MIRFVKKLRLLGRRRQLDRDLEDELRFHFEMKAGETGDPIQARRMLGNATAWSEKCRELWIFGRIETWWHDVRYALRTLAKSPGFTIVAVAALGLGIGADTAIFTIANGALTWNLGLDHLDRTVLVNMTDAQHRQDFGVSYPDFLDLRSQTKSFAGLAAYQFASVNLSDNRTFPERYHLVTMSANGFAVSEQRPALGRVFGPEDERPGAPAVAVLTYAVWQDRYGKDQAIVGKTIRVNEVPVTVIGVMPSGKRFPEETDLWMPLIPDARLEQRGNRDVTLFGLLADSADMSAARAEINTIAGRLAKQYPETDGDLIGTVQPIAEITGVHNMRPLFQALWAAVGFVLLIACADVANMLLARGAGRMREICIRVAVGAGRARIVRQLLIESVLLSVAGGFLGWLVALGGLRWFDAGTSVIPRPVWLHLNLDAAAFIYLAAVSVGTGVAFGLVPALRISRLDVNSALKDGGHGTTRGRRALSLSNFLVVSEMALCIILLAGAGLMIRSALNLYSAPIGMNPVNVLTMRVNLPEAKYPLPSDIRAFHTGLKAQLESLAGVESTAVVSSLPAGGWTAVEYQLDGENPEPGREPRTGAIVAGTDYFRVMQVRPRRGRTFTASDGVAGVPVVVVNETFAAKFWPRTDALGKRLRLIENHIPQPWLTVVGVVPDILQNFRRPLDRDPLLYLPYAEHPEREMFVVARSVVSASTLAAPFRRAVQAKDPNLAVYDVRTLEHRLAENRLATSLMGAMFSIFAGVALLLAVIGLYAVIAHSVSQRTQEIGLRMALGAQPGEILRLVYAEGMRPILVGLGIGLPLAFGISHVLRIALIGVSPGDPITFLGVVLLLGAAGVFGCLFPARRAMHVDPIVALRYQ